MVQAALDALVVANVKERLFSPERLASVREQLVERRSLKDLSVQDRRAALQGEPKARQEKLTRLYRAIGAGAVELDDELRDRIRTLKTERNIAQASLDRIATLAAAKRGLSPERIEAFANLVQAKRESADIQDRKSCLRSVISCIDVDDDSIRIIGDHATLAAVLAARQAPVSHDQRFVSDWRARENEDENSYVIEITT